ncbi:tripartite tricarboxylate transporter substrate-binding protein [Muricoccus aerilatus]|uniref:tripartite tricarboxylate transporter substrate-binding protein n=1 Tax=Muricoccus aerilatus TaxID=452982 RepID=UPI0005C25624|nr:tripartite tricarboxylate transporter substrate-binding protein [Roseomonas aerilata]
MLMRRKFAWLGISLGGFTLPSAARAAPLDLARVIAGFPPGGTVDTVARRAADSLSPTYARSVIVENRTGAGGQIAAAAVKNASPEGAMVLLTPLGVLTQQPHTFAQVPYDPFADFTPLTAGASFEFAWGVGPAVPDAVRTVPQYLEWCRGGNSRGNFGSPAAGTTPHFVGIMLGRSAGVEMTHVGYRGTPPAILDMIGGQIPAVCGPAGEFLQYVNSGKCRVLATSGAQRSRFLPNVPTFVEQGFADLAFEEWFAFFAPARTPAARVEEFSRLVADAFAAPAIAQTFAIQGLQVKVSRPAELRDRLASEYETWGRIVKAVGFTPQS